MSNNYQVQELEYEFIEIVAPDAPISGEVKQSVLAKVQADLARLPRYANDEIEMFINGIPTYKV